MTERPGKPRMTSHEMALRVHRRGLEQLLRDHPAFRRFLFDLFVEAGLFYPAYQRGDPGHTSYLAGRTSLGLEVLHMLKAVRPDILSLIEAEGNLLEQPLTKSQESPDDDLDPPHVP